ncbi:hypothetical protein SAMN03159475_0111 [Pseudomonas sp. NFPP33]|nr:hypothetical protein [Pseudomonas sp. NFPP33]AGH89241.1 hypothetical protein [uncultured bacterium]SDA85332.1 hypothetical protein SAMN03159475_0111 [Pseudomonas sp. NFPP33]
MTIGIGEMVEVSSSGLANYSADIQTVIKDRVGEVTGPVTHKEAWVDFPASGQREAINLCLNLVDLLRKNQFGRLPIVDGPWMGGNLDQQVGTFEVEGDDLEFANPLTISPPGVDRVRYYRQQVFGNFAAGPSIWVWSTAVPANVGELLEEENKASASLLPNKEADNVKR